MSDFIALLIAFLDTVVWGNGAHPGASGDTVIWGS